MKIRKELVEDIANRFEQQIKGYNTMRDHRMSGEYQEKVREFVSREVMHCASSLMFELISKAEHFPEYQDDLCSLAYQPATEEEIAEGYEDGSEVFEHWIISEWLGKRLQEKGEAVAFDLFDFTVWGRTTTGQALYIDNIICDIYDDVQKEIQRLSLV